MTVDEAVAIIERVGRTVRERKTPADADKYISIGVLYNDCLWGGPGATCLPAEALTALHIEDMSADPRWSKFFAGNTRSLGLYRARSGCYWLLSYDAVKRDHSLNHVGTAADALQKFGKPA